MRRDVRTLHHCYSDLLFDAILDRYRNLYKVDSGNYRIQCYFKNQRNGTSIAGTSAVKLNRCIDLTISRNSQEK